MKKSSFDIFNELIAVLEGFRDKNYQVLNVTISKDLEEVYHEEGDWKHYDEKGEWKHYKPSPEVDISLQIIKKRK